MEKNSPALRYGFILCVWLVICRIFWDVGLLTDSGSLQKHKFDDLIAFAPTVRTAAAATTKYSDNSSVKKQDVQTDHFAKSNTTLTAEQEAHLKELIDFTLGDEIEREDLKPEQIQELLNDAISEAQEAFAKLKLRRR